MSLWSRRLRWLRRLLSPARDTRRIVVPVRQWPSAALGRDVDFDVYLPPGYHQSRHRRYPLLLCNDGQDLPAMQFGATLDRLWQHGELPHFLTVGVYAGPERIREYGTAHRADYRGRGDRAGAYRDFVLTELLPELAGTYRLTQRREETVVAGFSLGGLSALDLAWSHPEVFGAVGAFSASLWWRSEPVDPRDPDASRILHDRVRATPRRACDQRFWFQCGTLDETEDRNNNGIIDSIDDTLHLIEELRAHGYGDDCLRYLEMEGGEHTPQTWGVAMPDFLRWALGDKTITP